MKRWRVRLPAEVHPPFEVWVNGVRQREGFDYELRGDELLFTRELAKEGRLGPWRWLAGAFGIGSYGRNDLIDVRYERGGRTMVAHALDIEPPKA